VLVEVQGSVPSMPMQRVDNKFAIMVIKNPILHGQSNHIKVKYHLVWKSVENCLVKVEFMSSEE
jgi:hypothetical protein